MNYGYYILGAGIGFTLAIFGLDAYERRRENPFDRCVETVGRIPGACPTGGRIETSGTDFVCRCSSFPNYTAVYDGPYDINEPTRITRYSAMLYPQQKDGFDRTLSADTWAWLQQQAATHIAEGDGAAPEVMAHWKSIVAGEVPFGFTVLSPRKQR